MADETAAANPTVEAPADSSGGGPDPKKALYNKMVADKLYSKSYDEFTTQFSTPDKVDKLHSFLTAKGKYDKSGADFNNQFFPDVKKKDLSPAASSPISPASSAPSAPSPNIEGTTPAPAPVVPGSNSLTDVLGGQPQAPIVDVGDNRVVAQQAINEHQAEQQQQADQTKANLSAMMDQYVKSDKAKNTKLKAELDDPNSDYYKGKAADQAAKDKNALPADQQIIGTLANMQTQAAKGVGESITGLVTAANFLAHTFIPSDVLQGDAGPDASGRDQFDQAKDNINSYIKNVTDNATINLSDKLAAKVDENGLSKALGLLANFAPAAIAAGPTKGLSFFYQAYGQADKTVADMRKAGADISPQAENTYSLGNALLNYALMDRVNTHTMFSKFPMPLRGSILGSLSADAVKELTDKGVNATSDDVLKTFMGPAMTFDQRVRQLGLDAVKSYLHTGVDLSAMTTLDAMLKAGVNKENEATGGKEIFHQNGGDLINQYKDIFTSVAPAFAAFGAGRALLDNPGLLFHNSPYTNLVTDRLHADPSPENVAAIQRDLATIGQKQGWSDDDIANTQKTVETLADVAKVLPPDLPKNKFRDGIDLVTGRRQLQAVLDETLQRKQTLDPAVQHTVGPFEELLNAKIDQANDKLSTLVSNKPFTYYEADGEYFKKQQDQDPVKITKTRYDLEDVENTGKPHGEQANVIPIGLADKKGNPIPPKENEKTSESKPAKEAVPEPPTDIKPAAEEKPVKADVPPVEPAKPQVEENAKPEVPEAVTPPNPPDNGKEKTNAEKAGIETSGEKGLATKKDDGQRQDEELLKPATTEENVQTGGVTNTSGFSHEGEADRHWVENEKDPEALATRYHAEGHDLSNTADYKEQLIHSAIGNSKINMADYKEHSDLNNLKGDRVLAGRMDKTNSQQSIDQIAQEISHDGAEVTPDDIVNFINKYPKADSFKEGNKSDLQTQIEDRYKELTGNELTGKRAADAYNKTVQAKKDAMVSDEARDIIEKEGINRGNIDKLQDQFKGFPYTEEDFYNVKRYLDEQEKAQPAQRTGNNAPAQPGAEVKGVGGDEPTPAAGDGNAKPAGGTKPAGNGGTASREPVERTPTPYDATGDDSVTSGLKTTIDRAEKIDTEGTGKLNRNIKSSLTDEKQKRFDELRKKIKASLRQESNDTSGEQASGGFDREMYSAGIELTDLYFEAGVTKFHEYAQEMINDMGPDVIPYLESFYEGAKRLPGQKGDFDTSDTVEYIANKLTDPIATDPERKFVDAVKAEIAAGNKINVLALEGMAREAGMTADTRVKLQEYVEQALVEAARDIIDNPMLDDKEKFAEMVELYNKQPSLLQRSSTKVSLQQYSTPLPYAFSAGSYVNGINPDRVFDPTAGTGMLTVAFDPGKVLANELDKTRFQILQNLGFAATNKDAMQLIPPNVKGVVSNPPFGPSDTPGTFSGYTFNKLDQIIPLRALKGMDNAGRAAIIIGGHNEYDLHGSLKGSDFKFFNYLHHFYNVTDVINVDGALFAKQGTTVPTRLILINGRKEIPQGFAPLYDEASNKPVKSFEDLNNRVQERINHDENPTVLQSRVDVQPHPGNDIHVPTAGERPTDVTERPGAVSGKPAFKTDRTGVEGEGAGRGPAGGQTELTDDLGKPIGDSEGDHGDRQLADVPEPLRKFAEGAENGAIGPERSGEFVPAERPDAANRPTADQLVKNEKVPYVPSSRLSEAGSVIPSNMAYETEQNLKDLVDLYGPVDTFVANELGYADLDDLNNAFFAEQVDAIAMAIHQLKQGKGMIIGDMTGIGKGRIAAGLIRYAVQQGEVPTYFTENADLFSDIYRDMHGIGSGHLQPFIVNDPSDERDANVKRDGNIIYKAGTIKQKKMFFEKQKVPHGTKVVLCTYSQLSSESQVLKRAFIKNHTKGGFMFMDESHNIAGDSNSGRFFQDLLADAKGAAFFSATYAKRPDNMPVYAMKTSMQDANITNDALVEAIQAGGNALQEIVASQLVKAGQMIRRERDFTGVVNTFITLGADKNGKIDATGEKHREMADQVIDVCNAIIDFEKTHVLPELDAIQQELRKQGQKVAQTKSKSLSVANTPFASKMFNIVNQMLFSIKAPELAQNAIDELKNNNRKPLITFNSTMESFIKNGEYKAGDVISDTSFSASLLHGLKNTLRYRIEYPNGEKKVQYMDLHDLEPEAREQWDLIVKQIKAASTDMSISPIDQMTEILEKAGLKVGEITGRHLKLVFNEDHTQATVVAIPKRDASGMIHDFNNGGGGGKADVLLLNSAGATGFSMHADKSFKDQRQRVMINGQFKLDINKEIQTRGRIDRSNQVKRGTFTYMQTAIPAETRLAMMFSDKLKRLQANTAADQKSKANENEVTDFLNEYGDTVMTDYLRDNPSINDRLFQGADPAGIKDMKPGKKAKVVEGIARKATGRAALLKVAEQEKFYNEVSAAYNDYIDYLDSTDQNNLAVKSVNLEAKLISSGTFIEGKHTQSPFGQDSILEKVEANVLRKPMTKEELEEAIEHNLQGKTPMESSRALIADLKEHYNETLRTANFRYQERFDKQDEKDKKKYVGNPELYNAARQANLSALRASVESSNNDIQASIGKMEGLFRDFRVGSEQQVPSSISGGETRYTKGLFLGFSYKEKHAGNPFSPSNVLMKFAVLDGNRQITVSASRGEFINALYAGKAQMTRQELERMGNLRNEWENVVKESKPRETRYIVTGNILQAYRPNLGQLVSYTTDQGHIEKGILMPKDFNPSKEGKMMTSASMFQRIMAMKHGIDEFTSSDKNVTISRYPGSDQFFKIAVPRATKTGGKYFKNENILDMVQYGEFETRGGNMEAMLPTYRLMDFLNLLDKEFNTKFISGIELHSASGEADSEAGSEKPKNTPFGVGNFQKPEENATEPSLIHSKTGERIQAPDFVPPIELKKLPDIISDLAKGLNVKIYYARSQRSNAAGSYSPSAGGIKLSSVGNLDTSIHEVGHAIDDAFGLFNSIPASQNAYVMSELQWFADRGGSNPPRGMTATQKNEYIKREGIAEFTRAYAINKGMAFTKAPIFYAHFENTLPPDVLDVINEFGDNYLRYVNSTPLESIMSNIEEVPHEDRSNYKKFVEWMFGDKDGKFQMTPWDKTQVRLSNSGHGFEKSYQHMLEMIGKDVESIMPDENAKYLVRLFAGIDAKVGSLFDNGLVNGKNEPLIDARTGSRMNMKWLYNAFDTTSPESLKQDQALAIGFMFAERTIEKGIQFGRKNDISGIAAAGDKNDVDMAVDFLTKEFGQKLPREQKIRIMEGARRYQLWADKMMRYMVDKGRMSETTYRDIKEKNVAYVAFLPVQENQPGIENSFDNVSMLTKAASVGNVKTVIREMTGSTAYKRHPYISLMQNTAAMVKEADRNEILQSYTEPMMNAVRAMGDGAVNPFADVMMEVSMSEKVQGKPVLTVFHQGYPKYYMFSNEAKDVYDYIKGLTRLPALPGIATALPRLLRWTATRSPIFAKNHLIRTTFNRLIISRTGSGLGEFVKNKIDGEKELYALYGGSQNGYWLGNRIDYYKLQNQVIKDVAGKGKTTIINPVEWAKKGGKAYMELLHQSDQVNRTAEFRSAFLKARTPRSDGGLGFDDHNSLLYAAYQAKDTLNASVSGTWLKYINALIPFANVEVQGLKRNIKAATEGNLKALGLLAMRLGLYTLIPTLLMRMLSKLGDYEEEYDNLPAYQRDLGWNFKIPGHEGWLYMPKPYDSGLLSSGMDRAIGQYGGAENAWHGFDKTLYQSLLLMKPEMAGGPLSAVVEPMTNYSFFKQGPIVPRYEEDKLLSLRKRYNEASRLGKGVSWAASPMFRDGDSIDPRYIDNMMQTMFSYYGDWGMSLSDIGSTESRHKFGMKTTGFIKDQQIFGDARVEKFFGVAKDLGMTESKAIKGVTGLIRDYYNATDPKERKELHDEIMTNAKEIYKEWMDDDIYKEKIESRGQQINFN